MKKLLLVLVILALLVGAFLAFRQCEPREKPPEEGEQEQTEPQIDFRSAFVEANVEFTCQIINDPQFAQDEAAMKESLNAAYKKYGFPVDDDEKMITLLDAYENDTEITETIKERVQTCQ